MISAKGNRGSRATAQDYVWARPPFRRVSIICKRCSKVPPNVEGDQRNPDHWKGPLTFSAHFERIRRMSWTPTGHRKCFSWIMRSVDLWGNKGRTMHRSVLTVRWKVIYYRGRYVNEREMPGCGFIILKTAERVSYGRDSGGRNVE